jgi:hypothetical protein
MYVNDKKNMKARAQASTITSRGAVSLFSFDPRVNPKGRAGLPPIPMLLASASAAGDASASLFDPRVSPNGKAGLPPMPILLASGAASGSGEASGEASRLLLLPRVSPLQFFPIHGKPITKPRFSEEPRVRPNGRSRVPPIPIALPGAVAGRGAEMTVESRRVRRKMVLRRDGMLMISLKAVRLDVKFKVGWTIRRKGLMDCKSMTLLIEEILKKVRDTIPLRYHSSYILNSFPAAHHKCIRKMQVSPSLQVTEIL